MTGGESSGRTSARARCAATSRTLLCALVASLAVAAPSASGTPLYGFSDYSVTGGQISATQSAALATQDGASSSRVTLNWSWVQPTPTAARFGTYDAIYNADLARGIPPVFVLTGSPSWTWAPGATCPTVTPCLQPPGTAHDGDWQSIAAQVAARYPQLAGIEIWNEPNMNWAWNGTPDPARYTQLLRLAYSAIKRANPSMPVIAGSLAASLGSAISPTSYPAPMFLQAMYANGARGSMDGLSVHPYPKSIEPWYTYKTLSTITETRNDNGDSSPLWITETGLSTTAGFTTTQQAIVLSNLVPALLAYPDLRSVYVNTLVEQTAVPAGAPNRGYGVLYPNQAPKPAYCTLANAFHTGYRCPLLVAQPQASATQQLRWQAENLLQWAAAAAIAWYKGHRTYQGLTSPALNAIDPRISAAPLSVASPGVAADPSGIDVSRVGDTGLLLCNASRADRSYCILTRHHGSWVYGKATGPVSQAQYAVLHGISVTW